VSRVNDVGGQQGFGAIHPDLDEEPEFHADWEARVFTLQRVLLRRGAYNLDEFRDAVERMPPQDYLTSSYYERWLAGIETLLAEKGVLDRE
jgi:nitrile hydratase subunit beta